MNAKIIKTILIFMSILLLVSCENNNGIKIKLNDVEGLKEAILKAEPGDEIILENGIWNNFKIKFNADGKKDKPIVLRAEENGKVFIEGKSYIKLGGNYLTVKGLYFRNGYTPSSSIIEFKSSKNNIANHCRVTECVIEEFTKPNRNTPDHWIEFWGRHNSLDHCYIAGKSNQGPTIRVYLNGNENIKNYHQIVNNYFGPRPRRGGPKSETIQIGDSYTSMTPSNMSISNNYFDKCNGEVEIISNKSNFNEFRNNVFFESEGSLVLRHGNYCIVDGNIFIGNDSSKFVGGIRVINTGHWITNNYFYKVMGDEFRSPLAIMNGIPKSPLNRYNQVTDVVVAYNSWIDCKAPWQFSVGANINKSDVLPKQEIRSARPKRVLLANNLIVNSLPKETPIVEYDKVDGIKFKNNIISNDKQLSKKYDGIKSANITLQKISDNFFIPSDENTEILADVYHGYDFENIQKDILGNSRMKNNKIGANAKLDLTGKIIIDKKIYGPSWFSLEKPVINQNVYNVNSSDLLAATIKKAKDGDIIELNIGTYSVEKSFTINKRLTIKSKGKPNGVVIKYNGVSDSPLFEMNPKGSLTLDNIFLKGKNNNYAFATLNKNMSSAYNLNVNNSTIVGFKRVLIGYKGSFADHISFTNTNFDNCNYGIVLASETDDKGDYNVEFLTFKNCKFNNIHKDVINFYRGGYDESTIGGNLLISSSTFKNCGAGDKSHFLIKNRGIVNVDINNNMFINNPIKVIALLWGEKNNIQSNNKIQHSGKIITEKYLKQKLVY